MKTDLSKLISTVTKAEGKKKSVSVGNVREIFKVLKNICANDPEALRTVIAYLVK